MYNICNTRFPFVRGFVRLDLFDCDWYLFVLKLEWEVITTDAIPRCMNNLNAKKYIVYVFFMQISTTKTFLKYSMFPLNVYFPHQPIKTNTI